MDAPLHFSADEISVDLIPVSDLVVPLAVIDISSRARDNPDASVTPDDIKDWEAKNGPLPEGCCVAMNSGSGELLMTPKFAGRDDAGKNHTPGFHGETGAHADVGTQGERSGSRYAFTRHGLNTGPFPVHYSWLPSGRWGVECLAHLDTVPAKGAPRTRGSQGQGRNWRTQSRLSAGLNPLVGACLPPLTHKA